MKIAVMQPYFFPYVGYFELIRSVDTFVFLTDVQFTRKGWINRNRIRSKEKDFEPIVAPVIKCPLSTNIKDVLIFGTQWAEAIEKKLRHTYSEKSNHAIVKYVSTLNKHKSLNDMLCESIMWTCNFLGINTKFAYSQGISDKTNKDKILEICKSFNCDTYVNACGGSELYSTSEFSKEGIELTFMQPTLYQNKFSIVDSILTDEKGIKQWLQ
jgi:hypothetical protein